MFLFLADLDLDYIQRLLCTTVFYVFLIQEYGVEFSSYFNVMWREPRLYIPHSFLGEWNSSLSGQPDELPPDDALIPVNLELVKQLWLPNIFIYNLKTFKVTLLFES